MHQKDLLILASLLSSCGQDHYAMSLPLKPYETTCLRGINQNRDNASFDQCYDALNVWAINGRIDQRPGSVGLVPLIGGLGISGTAVVWKEHPIGTFNQVTFPGGFFSSLSIGDRIYFGSSVIAQSFALIIGTWNTAKSRAFWEYWNGTSWNALTVTQAGSTALFPPFGQGGTNLPINLSLTSSSPPPYLFAAPTGAADYFFFVPPADWTNTVAPNTSVTANQYYIRFTLTEANFSANVGGGGGSQFFPNKGTGSVVGVQRLVLTKAIATTVLERLKTSKPNDTVGIASTLNAIAPAATLYGTSTIDPTISFGGNTSFAAVLATGEVYAAYGHKTFRIQTNILGQPGSINYAQVESNPLIVGIGGTYDSSVTAELTNWPAAKVVLYHDNQLWAIDDGIVRWSGQDADVIGHNVWPALQFEYLQGDATPVVGAISAFNRVWIFKQNAIYASVLQGVDPNFGNVVYTFQRIVSGRGAVSLNAIWAFGDNRIAFLSEDGIWSIDSTGQLKRLTLAPSVHTDAQGNQYMVDRLINFFDPASPTAINASARQNAAGIDWATKGVFLLSVPTGSNTTNDTTLVYDYRQDSWWIWSGAVPGTNFAPAYWTKDVTAVGTETLYYADPAGNLYQMVDGFPTDHGAALNPYVTLEPIGYKDGTQSTLRKVNVDSTNDSGVIQISAFCDDNQTTARAVSNINRLTDWREPVYSAPGGGTPTNEQDDYTKVATYGVSTYSASRARRRMKTFGYSAGESITFRMCQLKISQSKPGAKFRIGKIEALVQGLGRRPG